MAQTYSSLPFPQASHQVGASDCDEDIPLAYYWRSDRRPPAYAENDELEEHEDASSWNDLSHRESTACGTQCESGARGGAVVPVESTTSMTTYWNGLPWHRYFGDIVSIILAICFLILGICVAKLHGQEVTPWSTRVTEVAQWACSLWPIIFSAIVGNCVRLYANWKVQRGAMLLHLEQLLGSLTMASTVISVCTLSALNVWALVLVLLWASNPLGSQSLIRSVHSIGQSSLQSNSVSYADYTLDHVYDEVHKVILPGGDVPPTTEVLYSSVLTSVISWCQYCNGTCRGFDKMVRLLGGNSGAATKVAMDPWGNPVIPKIRNTLGYDPANAENWVNVAWNESIQDYVSLIGKRFYDVDPGFVGNTTFTMSVSYMDISNCSQWICVNGTIGVSSPERMDNWFATNYKLFTTKYFPGLDKAPYDGALNQLFTGREPGDNSTAPASPPSYILDYSTTYSANYTVQSTELFVAAKGEQCGTCVTACSVETIYVEARVFCMARGTAPANCGIDRIRRMPEPPLPSGNTLFNARPGANTTMKTFLDHFAQIGRRSGWGGFTDRFIRSPSVMYGAAPAGANWCNMSDSMGLFEDRLAFIFNTFLDATTTANTTMGASKPARGLRRATAAAARPLPDVHGVRGAWMAVYFAATAVMLLAALAGLALRRRLVAPPVLGTVGALLRDSPYFAHLRPAGSSTESGEAASKRLRRERVAVVDVQAGRGVGWIALAPVGMGKFVRKGRQYE